MDRERAVAVTPARAARWVGRRLLAPPALLATVLLVVLAYLVIAPLFAVVTTSLVWQPADTRLTGIDVEVGRFTLYHWQRVLASPLTHNLLVLPLLRTLVVALGVMAMVAVVGAALAWLVVRTDVAFKGAIATLSVLPYVLPSWTIALAWLTLFRNQGVGAPRGFLEYALGWQAPEWLVYGPVPIIIALGIHYFPFGYLFFAGALKNLNTELEESADILGLSRWQTLVQITFPIIMPAILSVLLLAFARSIGTFGTPAILGLPVRYYVVATQIYSLNLTGREGQAYVLALMLMAIASVGLYLNFKVLGTRRSFDLVSGKGGRSRIVKLARWRIPIGVGTLLFLAAVGLFPLLLLVWSSLMTNQGDYSLGNLSLHHWIGTGRPGINDGQPGVLRNPLNVVAIWNSLRLGLVAGFACGVLGLLIGYLVARMRGSLVVRFIEQVSLVPMLVPSIAFGAIYLSLFGRGGPLAPALYGTFTLLVLVTIGKQLPYAARAGISGQMQVSKELEEAASVLSVPWHRRFARILFPLTRPAFLAGALIVFITTMRELSLYIMLVTPRIRLVATQAFWYTEVGFRQLADAFTVLLVAVILVVTGLVTLLNRLSGGESHSTP